MENRHEEASKITEFRTWEAHFVQTNLSAGSDRPIYRPSKVVVQQYNNYIPKKHLNNPSMLSYISKTVSKAYKASKKALRPKQSYKETSEYRLFRALEKHDSEILPTTKLAELAAMSYDLDQFSMILSIVMMRLDVDDFDWESVTALKQFRNFLIVVSYLIKHGASGFIDELRSEVNILKTHYDLFTMSHNKGTSTKLKYYMAENANRLKYIIQLLEDKNKLIREKQISMLIKQKLKIAEKDKENKIPENNEEEPHHASSKVDGFLDNYLWKYAGIIDGKLDQIAEVIANKFQKYLLQEIPENFQIDEQQIKEENKIRTEINFAENKMNEEKNFLEKKQNIKKKANEDLLEI